MSAELVVAPQLGHSGPIEALAFARDGHIVVTGSGDRTVKLWHAATGRELRTLSGHAGAVMTVALSPDGRTVAAGSKDKTVTLWHAATGRMLTRISGFGDPVTGVAFSPDGRMVATASEDRTLKLWDASSGKAMRTVSSLEAIMTAIVFSPDGRTLAAGSLDGSVLLWDAESGVPGYALRGHTGEVRSVAFSPDGRTIVSAGADKSVKVWNVENGQELRALPAHADNVLSVEVSPDGATILSVSDPAIKLWDLATGRERGTLSPPANRTQFNRAAAFSPDGRTIVSASLNTLKLWDVASRRELRALSGRGQAVNAVAFSPDGRTLAWDGTRGSLTRWDLASGRALPAIEKDPTIGTSFSQSSLAFTPDGRTVVSTSGAALQAWDLDALRNLRVGSHGYEISTVAVAPDGRIAIGGNEHTVKIWDLNGTELRSLKHASWILAVAFSPDGRLVASLGADRTIKLFDAASGRELRTLRNVEAKSVAFSRDGRTIVSGWNRLKLWDVASGRELRTLAGQPNGVQSLAFSPDGRTIVAGLADQTLKLWDAGSGRELRTLAGHANVVTSVMFSPDGRMIVSGSKDGTVRLWRSADGTPLATLVGYDDGEWIIITPEGHFDASPNGAKLLNVVRGLDVYSVDQFYQALYRPDLVREKLAGGAQGKAPEAAPKLTLDTVVASGGAPQVALAAAGASGGAVTVRSEQVEVTATIADAGGGVGKVEWRVNGLTLGLEARGFDRLSVAAPAPSPATAPAPSPATAPAGPAGSPAAPLVLKRTLTLSPGENVVEVVAYNAANLIASTPTRLGVVREGSARTPRPRLHVMAVGVNEYRDSRLRLTYATADAKALAEGLRKSGASLYESVEVTTVLDQAATASHLDKAFAEIARKVRPDDVFVFFLAGHGKTVDGRYYFLPHDFRYAGDETIVSHGIGQDQWQDWFARIPARKSLLLYDTCESGSLTGDRVAMRGIERVAALERMTRATGRTTLTASTDDAPALEGYRGHGVFTYALLDALGKADGNGDGFVDVTELASFIDTQVPELSFQAFRQRQFPQMRIVGSNFPVASKASLLPAGVDVAAPIPARHTHVVITAADVFAQAGGAGGSAQKLAPGTMVTLMRSEQGWVLVARDGKPLGFVAQQHLLAAQ